MMDINIALKESLALVERSPIAMVGSVDENGFPNIKAMLNLEYDCLKTIWFSTNTSSTRVAQFTRNHKACVYYVDQEKFMGLLLVGRIQVQHDTLSRQRLWRTGFEKYYPLGVADPDYSVLCFTSERGNYYHALKNLWFDVE
jgi:general stress protein 26